MQFTTTLATLILAATTLAAPAPIANDVSLTLAPEADTTTTLTATPEISLEERGNSKPKTQPLIDLWKNPNFLDLKFTGEGAVGECVDLPKKFTDISSSGKAKPGFRCTIWVKKDCKGDGFSFNEKPGSKNFPSWIDDKASSWKCVKDN